MPNSDIPSAETKDCSPIPGNRVDFLNELIRRRHLCAYLEIGCDSNATFNQIAASHKVGVDPARGGTVRLTSDAFFRENSDVFDLVFIDGLHLEEQVLRDVGNALCCLSENGVIVLHDCLPTSRSHQEREPSGDAWTGDVWKAVVALRRRPDIDIATYNIDWGLGTILHRPNSNILELPDEPLTWERYLAERVSLLRVMDYAAISVFVDNAARESPTAKSTLQG